MKKIKDWFYYRVICFLRINKFTSFYSSHSQFGEDMVLRGLIGNKRKGFYIDIGAPHPIYYSNTYHFHLKGWRGINIDALPGSMETFNDLRPNDINVEACMSDQDGQKVNFYEFSKPALNSFDKEYADSMESNGEKIVRTHKLETKTLATILKEHQIKQNNIDFLTIDIEGIDEIVLKSINFTEFRPNYIVFESHDFNFYNIHENEMISYLKQNNYEITAKAGPSLILKDLNL